MVLLEHASLDAFFLTTAGRSPLARMPRGAARITQDAGHLIRDTREILCHMHLRRRTFRILLEYHEAPRLLIDFFCNSGPIGVTLTKTRRGAYVATDQSRLRARSPRGPRHLPSAAQIEVFRAPPKTNGDIAPRELRGSHTRGVPL